MRSTTSRRLATAIRHLKRGNLAVIARQGACLATNTDFAWRYLFNFAPTLAYMRERHTFSRESTRIIQDLNENGLAITSVEALLGPNSYYDELNGTVDRLERQLREQLDAARSSANNQDATGQKTFIFQLLGSRPVLNPDDIYVRFALQRPLLGIANAYFGMCTVLRSYNVWHTFTTQVPARESQLWHRGQKDRQLLKVFVYLSDVDDGAGPFTYAACSHSKGALHGEADYFVEQDGIRRSTEEQMAALVPPAKWIKCIGPKGTIVFADTSGYHKGGLAREHERLLYYCMFTSQACEMRERFQRPAAVRLPEEAEPAFALSPPRLGNLLTPRRSMIVNKDRLVRVLHDS